MGAKSERVGITDLEEQKTLGQGKEEGLRRKGRATEVLGAGLPSLLGLVLLGSWAHWQADPGVPAYLSLDH